MLQKHQNSRLSTYPALSSQAIYTACPYRGHVLNRQWCAVSLHWVTGSLGWRANNWEQDFFSDESRCCLSHGDGRVRVWHRRGEHYDHSCFTEQDQWDSGGGVVWSGMHSHGRNWLLLNSTLNAQCHADKVIKYEEVPYVQSDRLTFQQDNAFPSSICIAQDFHRSNAGRTLPWPAYSTLYPTEHRRGTSLITI